MADVLVDDKNCPSLNRIITDSRDSSLLTADKSRIEMIWEPNSFDSQSDKLPSRPQSIDKYNVHTKTPISQYCDITYSKHSSYSQSFIKMLNSEFQNKARNTYIETLLDLIDATDNLLAWYRTLLTSRARELEKMSKWEEEFEDTKGVIRIRKSKNRQHHGKKKKWTHQKEKQQHLTLVVINMQETVISLTSLFWVILLRYMKFLVNHVHSLLVGRPKRVLTVL